MVRYSRVLSVNETAITSYEPLIRLKTVTQENLGSTTIDNTLKKQYLLGSVFAVPRSER
jgi:phage baseplate assembly protein W